eukprot:Selendium_serpulae@DN7936_c0_g1_i1.p1
MSQPSRQASALGPNPGLTLHPPKAENQPGTGSGTSWASTGSVLSHIVDSEASAAARTDRVAQESTKTVVGLTPSSAASSSGSVGTHLSGPVAALPPTPILRPAAAKRWVQSSPTTAFHPAPGTSLMTSPITRDVGGGVWPETSRVTDMDNGTAIPSGPSRRGHSPTVRKRGRQQSKALASATEENGEEFHIPPHLLQSLTQFSAAVAQTLGVVPASLYPSATAQMLQNQNGAPLTPIQSFAGQPPSKLRRLSGAPFSASPRTRAAGEGVDTSPLGPVAAPSPPIGRPSSVSAIAPPAWASPAKTWYRSVSSPRTTPSVVSSSPPSASSDPHLSTPTNGNGNGVALLSSKAVTDVPADGSGTGSGTGSGGVAAGLGVDRRKSVSFAPILTSAFLSSAAASASPSSSSSSSMGVEAHSSGSPGTGTGTGAADGPTPFALPSRIADADATGAATGATGGPRAS